jgi:hypothetical protein
MIRPWPDDALSGFLWATISEDGNTDHDSSHLSLPLPLVLVDLSLPFSIIAFGYRIPGRTNDLIPQMQTARTLEPSSFLPVAVRVLDTQIKCLGLTVRAEAI